MKKKEIIRMLEQLDDKTAAQLGGAYFTADEDARMQRKIAEKLCRPAAPGQVTEEEPAPVVWVHRFAWLRSAAMTAACATVCCGMAAGLFWLKAHAPVQPEYHTQTSVPDGSVPAQLSHAVGERYAAENLTGQGELLIAVQSADYSEESGLYEITLELTSEDAMPLGDTDVFYADNFLVAVGQASGIWKTVSPCGIQGTDAVESPYAIRIEPQHSVTVTLSYALGETPPLAFVTSNQTNIPYTTLTEESHEKE